MAKTVRLHPGALRKVRRSPETRRALVAEAETISGRANQHFRVTSELKPDRARAAVVPTKDTPGEKARRALDRALRSGGR